MSVALRFDHVTTIEQWRRLSTPQYFTKLCRRSYVSSENSLINSTVSYYVILKLFIKTFLEEDIGNVLKVRSSEVQAPIRAEDRRRRDRLENIERKPRQYQIFFEGYIKRIFAFVIYSVCFYKYFTCNFGNRILSVIEIFYAA